MPDPDELDEYLRGAGEVAQVAEDAQGAIWLAAQGGLIRSRAAKGDLDGAAL